MSVPLQYYGNAVYHEDLDIITTGFAGNIITKPKNGSFFLWKMGKLEEITRQRLDIMIRYYKKSREFEPKIMNNSADHHGIISDWIKGYSKAEICIRKDISISKCIRTLKGM